MSSLMNEFIDLIVADGKYTKEELNAKLSTLDGYNSPKSPLQEMCAYKFKKGKFEGHRCDSKVSPKSSDGKHCAKHSPKLGGCEPKEGKEGEEETKTCMQMLTKGARKDEECGKRVSPKCPYGLTCSAHLAKGAILNGGEIIVDAKSADKKKPVGVQKKCSHILTTGNNKGNACGVSVTEKSASTELCTRHASTATKKGVTVPIVPKKPAVFKIFDKALSLYCDSETKIIINKKKEVVGMNIDGKKMPMDRATYNSLLADKKFKFAQDFEVEPEEAIPNLEDDGEEAEMEVEPEE
jgi:hypothetical protein